MPNFYLNSIIIRYPNTLKNYFVKLKTIHLYYTRQKTKKNFFHYFARTEWGRKMIQRKGLNV